MAICFTLLTFYSFYYFPKFHPDDTARFGGDTWEYQSMAVNWAKGYGLKFAAIGPFEVYKFTEINSDVSSEQKIQFLTNCKEKNCKIDPYRTPGYPLFLGIVYKIFGVSPKIAKIIQLLLPIIIASFLPFIGWYFWKKIGLASGIISGFIFLHIYTIPSAYLPRTMPTEILTETLITFCVFLLTITYIFWHKYNKNPILSFILGTILGISLLVKGSNIFTPLLFIIYFVFLILHRQTKTINLFLLAIGIIITILPWSITASKSNNRLIILSTQAENALLDCNNQFTIDGSWHPEGYSSNLKNSYYNQDWIKKYPDPIKVLIYYYQHPNTIPITIFHKINKAFNSFSYLKLLLVLLITSQLISSKINYRIKLLSILLTLLFYAPIFLFTHMGMSYAEYYQPLSWFFVVPISLFFLSVVLIVKYFIYQRLRLNLPIPFLILFINYFLIIIITLGMPRYVQPLEFWFILISIKYLLSFLLNFSFILPKLKKNQWKD